MIGFFIELSAMALIVGGGALVVGAVALFRRALLAALILAVTALVLASSGRGINGIGLAPVEHVLIAAAAVGVCLAIFGQRWAAWLALPAALWLFVLPLACLLAPFAPLWAWLVILPILPVFGLIFAIRGAQAILKGLFGADAAAYVVGRWIFALIGSFGRRRRAPFREPELPRPRDVPIHLHHYEVNRDR